MKKVDELALLQAKDMERMFPQYIPALSASREEIQEIRNQRLRKLLAYVKKNSPWYQKTLSHINPDTFTERHLSEIPILNKKLLMDNWDLIVTDKTLTLALAESHLATLRNDPDSLYFNNKFHVLATSGSTGKRSVIVCNWIEWIEGYIYTSRFPRFAKIKYGIDVTKGKGRVKIAQVIINNAVYAMYAYMKTFQLEKYEYIYIPMTLPVDEIVKSLNSVQPFTLISTPSILYKLCRQVELGLLNINPVIIMSSGEALYPPIRALIRKTWPHVLIKNIYGATEGVSAFNCKPNSLEMHLNEDSCIIEPVNSQYQRVPLGVLSDKIIVTNLYRYTQPLIRFELTDQIQFLDKKCTCGIEHQLIAEPKGRPEFDFMYPNNIFVHHLNFVTPLLLEKSIVEYQVVQTLTGVKISVATSGSLDASPLKREIVQLLVNLGLRNPEVTIVKVKSIPYPESGKIRRFIPLDELKS